MGEDHMKRSRPLKSPGGARWCEKHGRYECTRNSKRTKTTCHQVAIPGTDACKHHAGVPLEVQRAKGEAITAWSALGGEPEISHTEVVLRILQLTWLRVNLYGDLLRQQFENDKRESSSGGDGENKPHGADVHGNPETGGLIGFSYSGVKDIGIFASGEAMRGLTRLEADERDRAVRFAKVAHEMGVADAVIDVIRKQADQVQTLLVGVVSRLGFEWGDPTVVAAVQAALGELDAANGGDPGGGAS
ncbi:hypothetical protein [Phytoactinopolyspora limicola]|uniref:hypothetical protein n=1 Tax=Phytoactinopolyspora limicola TaxID=2715536 RepID=UPI00140BAC35|nr:hypothetical protein [Phytoactinopolyspora limicola]